MLLFFSQGPVNLGLSQKQLLPLHWVHSAGESRDSLEPSLCCCSGVNRFLVGLQSVPGNLSRIQKNFSFHTQPPWFGTVKVGCCSMLQRVERVGAIQPCKLLCACYLCLMKRALLKGCSSHLQPQINGRSGHTIEQEGLLSPQPFSLIQRALRIIPINLNACKLFLSQYLLLQNVFFCASSVEIHSSKSHQLVQ